MPLTNAIHESLPYIDTEPSASERAAALSLIAAEASSQPSDEAHDSLPPLSPPNFTPLITSELDRISQKIPITGITTTHYESQDPPSTSPNSDTKSPETLLKWRTALQNAYTSQSYLSGRVANLGLLEKYGKNAWLEGNRQLEDVLRGLERELEERKAEIDGVVIERKRAQEEVGGEIKGLEETWKRGVGRVLETEVAAEGLRREILERRREGAL
ncbi:Pre-mRNA-splicing factor SPF27 [Cadophora sp. MPI-SDFR-AT-0126]|nr:Pre-mRNA-splicing factor SPF27 [Leotiomycetes sp. MPI-SDFR-AT-0126]